MMIVKDPGSPKKIKIRLHSNAGDTSSSPTESVTPLSHPKKANVREIGLLKQPTPIATTLTSPQEAVAIPSELSLSLAKYEADAKRASDLKISQYETNEMNSVREKIEAFRHQQNSIIQSEMAELRDQGYKDGYAQGQAKGEGEYSDALIELADAINTVTENKRKFFEQSEPELLQLSLKIAEKIVQTQINLDQNTMIKIVNESIRRITDKDKVIIKVCPEDSDFIRQNREQILAKMPDIRTLEIEDDPRIERGGCIIETRLGFIDSLISTKLASVEAALFKVYNDR